jgi:hypothetical protein
MIKVNLAKKESRKRDIPRRRIILSFTGIGIHLTTAEAVYLRDRLSLLIKMAPRDKKGA